MRPPITRSAPKPSRRLSLVVVTSLTLLVPLTGLTPGAFAAQHHASAVATIKFIKGGLSVRAPHAKAHHGKVNQSLYPSYWLGTGRRQMASLGFRDGTMLHMQQLTDVVLRSPNTTYVDKGEVYQQLVPGTSHRVETKTATAAAIGTQFDVRITGKGTFFIVVEGSLKVQDQKGSVIVKNNQETFVAPNKAPQAPQHVDAAAATTWTHGVPTTSTASLGENLALDSNGGHVVDYSSASALSPATYSPRYIDDGRLNHSWRTADGAITDQWLMLAFAGERTYRIWGVAIDPAAVNDPGASNDLKDFEIKVSTTDRSPGSFSTVFSGSAKPGPTLQRFEFAHPVAARYVELLAVNNEGGISAIEVAELEVVGDPNPLPEQPATPTPKPVLRAELPNTATPTPTDTPTPTPTATLVHVARPKPTVSYPSLPTATSTPVRVITVKKTPTATPTPTPPSSGCNDQDQDPASYHHSANFGPKPHPDPCHAK